MSADSIEWSGNSIELSPAGASQGKDHPMSQDREQAIEVARTDSATALRRARAISDPWYRAQALAWVARYASEADVERIADEALKAARAGRDGYQQAGSSAWAIRALAERGRTQEAATAVPALVSLAAEIAHPVSRLNALFLLLQAAWSLDRDVRSHILDSLVAACRAAASWQSGRTLHNAVLMLAAEDIAEARRILERMPEGRYRRQADRALQAGQTLTPRPFFW